MTSLDGKFSHDKLQGRTGRWKRCSMVRCKGDSSSSSTSAQLPKKSICFWGWVYPENKTEWFFFDVEDAVKYKRAWKRKNKEQLDGHHYQGRTKLMERGILKPFSVTKFVNTSARRCASMGPLIYRVGGEENFRKKVFSLDLRCRDSGWVKRRPMITARVAPWTVALDGKLYVLGKGNDSKPGLWAEVYDPVLVQWETLPPPPNVPEYGPVFCAAIDASKKILVGLEESKPFYMYDTKTKSWEKLDIPCESLQGRATVVGQTVYWYSCGCVMAVDLELKMRFMGLIDLQMDMREYDYNDMNILATLLHLEGEKFCLFWVDSPIICPEPLRSHCLQIRVVKYNDSLEGNLAHMDVFIESCQSYTFDHKIYLLGALVVDKSSTEEMMQD